MNLRAGFYKHPFAVIITGVFLYSLLMMTVYYFGLIPGIQKTQQGLTNFFIVTLVLLATTVATWVTAMVLSSDSI